MLGARNFWAGYPGNHHLLLLLLDLLLLLPLPLLLPLLLYNATTAAKMSGNIVGGIWMACSKKKKFRLVK